MLRGIVLMALSAAELPPEDQPAVGSATDSAAAVRHAFADFLEEFDKVYAEEEVPQRFKTFEENYRRVLEHNTMASPYTQSINEFADLTEEEFAAKHLGFNGSGTAFEGWPYLGDHFESAVDASSLDWRDRGAVTPVKNQGQCGACWTFSATGGLEGAGKLTTGDLVSLSEQEILDCSESQGCGGGNMAIAFSFAKTHTITVEENYPYTAQEGTCKQESWTYGLMVHCVEGYRSVSQSASALMSAVNQQPVSVAVSVNLAFSSYKSGVFTADCPTKLNHAVLLVGFGTEGGNTYWLVKNSWGTRWGESGYIRLARDATSKLGKCGIQTQSSYPVLSGTCSVVPQSWLQELVKSVRFWLAMAVVLFSVGACVCVTCLGKRQRGQRRQVLPLREARAPVILASATWSTAGQPLAATPPASVPSAPPNTQEMRDARLSRFG